MNAVKFPFTSQWFRWKEVLITTLVGWIPLSIGRLLRRAIYRFIFGRFGKIVQIKSGVEYTCTYRIEIGNNVNIDHGVCLRNEGQNSRIILKDFAMLDLGVLLKTHNNGVIEIGSSTYIGPYSCLSGKYIKVGEDCRIASHVGIYANNHNFADSTRKIKEQGSSYKGIVIENDCWLGSGVKVVDGVTVGQGSVIGAGAVVTKNIPPYSIAVGVPAKVIKNRKLNEQIVSTTLTEVKSNPQVTTPQQITEQKVNLHDSILSTLLHQLLDCTRQVINVDTITVLLHAEDKQHLAVYASIGLEDEITAGIKIPLGRGFAGRVAAACQPTIVEDLSIIEIVSPILRNKGLQSILGIPLQAEGKVLGVFHVGSFAARKFTKEEVKLLELFANFLGFAIAHTDIQIYPFWKYPGLYRTCLPLTYSY